MATPGYISVEIPESGMIFEIRGKQFEAGLTNVISDESGIKVFTTFYPVTDEGDRIGKSYIVVDLDLVDMKLI